MFESRTLKRNAPVLPILAWIGFLVGSPLIYVLVLSFLSRDDLGNIVWVFTLENYRRIVDPVYLKVFLNSFLLATLTGLVTLLVGYPVAYFTAQMTAKRRSLVILLIVIPFWISSLLRTYGWMILLGNTGLINNVLLALKLIDQPLPMMYRFGTVLIGTTYMLIPFMVIALFNAIDKLDRSLLEASRDLGGNAWKTFFKITVPLTLPGIAGGFVLVFIPALGLFFISDLLGGGNTLFLGNLINTQATRGRNKPLAAVFSMVMIGIVLLVLWLYNRLSKDKGEGLFL